MAIGIKRDGIPTREDTIKALAQSMKKEVTIDKEEILDINMHWIPVSERTPSEEECKRTNGMFLTSRTDGYVQIDKFFYDKDGYTSRGFYVKDRSEVVAWMNLPDPYSADTENV